MNSNSLAIILPAYNEELTIKESILAFHKAAPEAQIVVVDNNSSDATAQIVKSLDIPQLTLLFEIRQGKANAVRKAFQEVDADIYVMSDADMTYPAHQIEQLIEPIIEGRAQMVVGDRHSSGAYKSENKRSLHNFGNHLVKGLINRLFHVELKDIMSGYRAFSKNFVKNYPILVEGFELETDLTLHAVDKRLNIVEIEIEYVDRPEGSFSKLNTFSDGLKVLFTIVKIFRYYKPMHFFSILSILFITLALLSATPVFMDWIAYRYIYHVPLAILATGLSIVAIILFAIGLILDAISHHHKSSFEHLRLKD